MKFKVIIYTILINFLINLSGVIANEGDDYKLIYFFDLLNPNTEPKKENISIGYEIIYKNNIKLYQLLYNPSNYENYISKKITLNSTRNKYSGSNKVSQISKFCEDNKVEILAVAEGEVLNIAKKTKIIKEINLSTNYVKDENFIDFKKALFKNIFLENKHTEFISNAEISADGKNVLFTLKVAIPGNNLLIEKPYRLIELYPVIAIETKKYLSGINFRFNKTDVIEGEKNLISYLEKKIGYKTLNILYISYEIPLDIYNNLNINKASTFIEKIIFSYLSSDGNINQKKKLSLSKLYNVQIVQKNKKYRPVDLIKFKNNLFYIIDRYDCLKDINPNLEIISKKQLDFGYKHSKEIINYNFTNKKLFEIEGTKFVVNRIVFRDDFYGSQRSNSNFFVINLNYNQFNKIKTNRDDHEITKNKLIKLKNQVIINNQFEILQIKKSKKKIKDLKKIVLTNISIIIFIILLIYSYNIKKIKIKKYTFYYFITTLLFVIGISMQSKLINLIYLSIFLLLPYLLLINFFKKIKND